MNNRKVFSILIFAFLWLVFGCSNPKENSGKRVSNSDLEIIKEVINNSDNSLASNMFYEMKSAVFENDEVIYTCKPNAKFVRVERIRTNRSIEKQSIMSKLELAKAEDESVALYLGILAKNAVNIKYVYEGQSPNDTCQIVLSANDITRILKANGQLSIDHLNAVINGVKIFLPIQLDQMTKWCDYRIIGNNVTHVYEVDESIASMEDVMANYDLIKAGLSEKLLGEDNGPNDNFMHRVKALGLGMGYLYVGDVTHKRMEIIFDNEELL